jgi:cell division protein FtsB
MKKVALGVILIISLIIINNLARSIYNLWQKQELVTTTEKELEREKKVNANLKKQAAAVKDPDYLEKVARDKLFLAKPKEEVVILPKEPSGNEKAIAKAKRIGTTPHWKEWLLLFSFSSEN